MTKKEAIIEDTKISQVLHSLAENESWGDVFTILDEKHYLLNVIPDKKQWSILHLALIQNNVSAISKIVHYPNCDVNIKSRPLRIKLIYVKHLCNM